MTQMALQVKGIKDRREAEEVVVKICFCIHTHLILLLMTALYRVWSCQIQVWMEFFWTKGGLFFFFSLLLFAKLYRKCIASVFNHWLLTVLCWLLLWVEMSHEIPVFGSNAAAVTSTSSILPQSFRTLLPCLIYHSILCHLLFWMSVICTDLNTYAATFIISPSLFISSEIICKGRRRGKAQFCNSLLLDAFSLTCSVLLNMLRLNFLVLNHIANGFECARSWNVLLHNIKAWLPVVHQLSTF